MLTYMRPFVMKNRENNARKYIGKLPLILLVSGVVLWRVLGQFWVHFKKRGIRMAIAMLQTLPNIWIQLRQEHKFYSLSKKPLRRRSRYN